MRIEDRIRNVVLIVIFDFPGDRQSFSRNFSLSTRNGIIISKNYEIYF